MEAMTSSDAAPLHWAPLVETLTLVVVADWRSLTKTSSVAFVSPETRLLAAEVNTT